MISIERSEREIISKEKGGANQPWRYFRGALGLIIFYYTRQVFLLDTLNLTFKG